MVNRTQKTKGLIDETSYALPRPHYVQMKGEAKNNREIPCFTTFGTKNASMISNNYLRQRPQSFKPDSKVFNVAEVVAD